MSLTVPNSSSNALLHALRKWGDKGAATEDYHEILEHLGAAVMQRWTHLPRDVQRDLFNAAVDMNEPQAESVRQHIAVFLHQHKNDAAVDGGGEA